MSAVTECAPPEPGLTGRWWSWTVTSKFGRVVRGWTRGTKAEAQHQAAQARKRLNLGLENIPPTFQINENGGF